jgi:hypothetical protein
MLYNEFYNQGVNEFNILTPFEVEKNYVNDLFKKINVEGDGNCLYHVVAYYLVHVLKEEFVNETNSNEALRTRVGELYKFLESNTYPKWTLQGQIQKKLLQENQNQKNKASHQARMISKNEWSIDADISALSLILEKNIFVFHENEYNNNYTIEPFIYSYDFTTPVINIHFNGRNHYDAIVPRELIGGGKSKKSKKIKQKKNKSRRKHVKK